MGKKCIPGLFCIENMTLFVLSVLIIFLFYAFYKLYKITPAANSIGGGSSGPTKPPVNINITNSATTGNNAYDGIPPQNVLAGVSLPPVVGIGAGGPIVAAAVPQQAAVVAAVPINIETRPSSGFSYTQVGMLSRDGMILPLMGRRQSRDKWNYYTVSNSHLNVKLPVKVNGRNCSSEYGCDEIYSGDEVYVEGYSNTFTATVYENTRLNYLPAVLL
jgi:Family of unknown function (DUF5755)